MPSLGRVQRIHLCLSNSRGGSRRSASKFTRASISGFNYRHTQSSPADELEVDLVGLLEAVHELHDVRMIIQQLQNLSSSFFK